MIDGKNAIYSGGSPKLHNGAKMKDYSEHLVQLDRLLKKLNKQLTDGKMHEAFLTLDSIDSHVLALRNFAWKEQK